MSLKRSAGPLHCTACSFGFTSSVALGLHERLKHGLTDLDLSAFVVRAWDVLSQRSAPDGLGCIVWTATANIQGYGVMTIRKRKWLAHRAAWVVANGPIPDGLFVCHHCDNPPCVNVEHLFLGTNQDNLDDMARKNSSHRGKIHPETIRAIRQAPGPIRAIGATFGVPYSDVSRIRRGEIYRWVA